MEQQPTEIRRIYKYGLATIRKNRLLLCEPYAFTDLILPGGIIEGEETHIDNLLREVEEELGDKAILETKSLHYLGHFVDFAAGRTNVVVEIHLYLGNLKGRLKASSEIKKLHWFSPSDDWSMLSQIIRNKILPFLIDNNYLTKND